MNKQEAFRKFILIVVLTLFMGIGFLGINKFTARNANAVCPCVTCIGGGFATSVASVAATLAADIAAAAVEIIAWLETKTTLAEISVMFKIGGYTPFDGTRNDILNWIFDFWYRSLEPALADMTKELFAFNADQARTVASFMDASNFMRLVMTHEDQRLRSHREQRVGDNTVVMGTIMGGMGRADAFRKKYNTVAPTENTKRSSNYKTVSSGAGIEKDMKDRWDTYTSRYCRRDDNNKASGCSSDGTFPGQDLDVAGTIFSRETIDFVHDAEIKKTIDNLIANIAEPFINDPVPAKAVTQAEGQRAILEREAYKAKRQVIYDALYHVVSRRAPGSKIGLYTRPIREDAGISTNLISDNPSYNEIMHVMTNERYRNGKYSLEQIDEPEVNERELVIQQALQLMQLNDQIELLDRFSLLLAAQVGAEVRDVKSTGNALSGAPLQ